jgi:hypothetical protein
MMLGKAIVRWAQEQGLRGNKPLPTVTFTPKKKRVRPAFELWEYRRLWRTLLSRVNSAKSPRARLLVKTDHFEWRTLSHVQVILLPAVQCVARPLFKDVSQDGTSN